jgi:hypothetical protein
MHARPRPTQERVSFQGSCRRDPTRCVSRGVTCLIVLLSGVHGHEARHFWRSLARRALISSKAVVLAASASTEQTSSASSRQTLRELWLPKM